MNENDYISRAEAMEVLGIVAFSASLGMLLARLAKLFLVWAGCR